MKDKLFVGIFPCGFSYADRTREVDGDYMPIAFLPFRSLELEWRNETDPATRQRIIDDAAEIQARRGEDYQVSTSGQMRRLGE